jgi:hypothetical protein
MEILQRLEGVAVLAETANPAIDSIGVGPVRFDCNGRKVLLRARSR